MKHRILILMCCALASVSVAQAQQSYYLTAALSYPLNFSLGVGFEDALGGGGDVRVLAILTETSQFGVSINALIPPPLETPTNVDLYIALGPYFSMENSGAFVSRFEMTGGASLRLSDIEAPVSLFAEGGFFAPIVGTSETNFLIRGGFNIHF